MPASGSRRGGVAERLDRAGLPPPRVRVQQRTDASAVAQSGGSEIAGHYAVALMDRPTEQVMATLAADWRRWTDPSTPLRDLVDELGLTALPTGLDVPGAERIPQELLGDDPEDSSLLAVYRDVPLPPPESGEFPALLAIACP